MIDRRQLLVGASATAMVVALPAAPVELEIVVTIHSAEYIKCLRYIEGVMARAMAEILNPTRDDVERAISEAIEYLPPVQYFEVTLR